MKRLVLTAIIAVTAAYIPLQAEHVFLKSGDIVSGRIQNETADEINIKTNDGARMTIKQVNVLRVIYGEIYLGKQFVQMTSGDVLEGYIVAEEQTSYTFRKELKKADEDVILKEKVLYLSRNNPSELTATLRGANVILTWIAPRSQVKEYKIFLKSGEEKYPAQPFETTESKTVSLVKLKLGKKYSSKVVAIFPDGTESLPSNECTFSLETLPAESLNFKKIKEKNTNSITVNLNWKEPFEKPIPVKKYSVYQKTEVGYKRVGESESTAFTVKGLDAKNDYTFAVRTVNIKGDESEPSEPVFTGALDSWYMYATGNYIMPVGYILEGFRPGGGVSCAFTNSLESNWHFGALVSFYYLPAADAGTALDLIYAPLELSGGYNFKIVGTYLIFQPYIAAGYGLELMRYTTEKSASLMFDPVVSAGVRLPFRAAGLFVVPFVEYKWIVDTSRNLGMMNFGVGVAL